MWILEHDSTINHSYEWSFLVYNTYAHFRKYNHLQKIKQVSRMLNQMMFLFIMVTIIFIIENEMNLGMSIRAYIKMRLISAVYPIHCSG